MTGTLVALLLLSVVAVAADRVAARAVEQTVAVRLAEAGRLETPPQVDVRRSPFLTQAARGRYDDVVVRADGVQAGQLRLRHFVAQLRGVAVPLSDAVSGNVVAVPVDTLTARAVLSYDDLSAMVADRGLRVGPAADGRARVTGSVKVLGRTVEASALSRATLEDGEVVVTAERFELGNGVADAVVSSALGDRLDFRITLDELPFGLQITEVRAAADGVVLSARADRAVLSALPAP